MTEMTTGTLSSRLSAIERLPVERLLVALAGFSAITLGLLAFILDAAAGQGAADVVQVLATRGPLLTLVVATFFGVLLFFAFGVMARSPTEGAVLALAFSLVLLLFGGAAGSIAGTLGIVGSAVAVMRHVRWTA